MKKINVFLDKFQINGKNGNVGIGKTNYDGIIGFQLPEPLPDRVGISFPPDEAKNCSELAFPTRSILAKGFVGGNNCVDDNKRPTAPPRAGELTIFVVKVSLREKMSRELP